MVLTQQQLKEATTEVENAIEKHVGKITEDNFAEVFAFNGTGKEAEWALKTCEICNRPTLMHINPWSRICEFTTENVMNQNLAGEYIDILENSKRIKQVARWVKPKESQEDSSRDSGYDKHTIFPLWEKGMSWDDYKTEINIYKAASTKKPASKFLDMIHALKASKKIGISKRL